MLREPATACLPSIRLLPVSNAARLRPLRFTVPADPRIDLLEDEEERRLADIRVLTVEASPTAVVRAATTWTEFPTLWGRMLDQVWRFLRDAPGDLSKDGHNVMLYEDDLPTVEVGVQVNGPFEPHGPVVPSILRGGLVATATHTGPIGRLGETHDSVCAWCAQHGYEITRVRWEIYGDPDASTGDFAVDVFWALAAA